eukprot:15484967-Alexandrium_andersonii.AAC.1
MLRGPFGQLGMPGPQPPRDGLGTHWGPAGMTLLRPTFCSCSLRPMSAGAECAPAHVGRHPRDNSHGTQ